MEGGEERSRRRGGGDTYQRPGKKTSTEIRGMKVRGDHRRQHIIKVRSSLIQ